MTANFIKNKEYYLNRYGNFAAFQMNHQVCLIKNLIAIAYHKINSMLIDYLAVIIIFFFLFFLLRFFGRLDKIINYFQ